MPTDTPPPKPASALPPDLAEVAAEGILIRADRHDILHLDDGGVTLRLSDTALAALRHQLAAQAAATLDPAELLGDIDAWNLRQAGDWLRFTGQLEAGQPARAYQRRVEGGDIIAEAPGPLYGIFALGGARRADFNHGPARFPYHVVAPGDHIGAVGLEGTAQAEPVATLQHIPHCTREALLAQTLLDWRRAALRGLPLFMTRAETDSSASLSALGQGQAYANFLQTLDNLVAAAASLGKRAKVLSVGLDFSLEDPLCSAEDYVRDFRALMARIERDMARRGLQRPIFLAVAEAGTRRITEHASIQAHWELSWSHGSHAFAFSAPGYMFAQTRFGRPTPEARLAMAEMEAHALVALTNRQPWQCPMFLLAEYHGKEIRVVARAMGDLVLDNALNAGPSCGFKVVAADQPVKILSVAVAADDPQCLILTCNAVPEGEMALLTYASGAQSSSKDAYPANRGAVRDQWSSESRQGQTLHRWALPAILPLHPGS